MIGSASLSVSNDVTRKETNSLLVGIFSEEAVTKGWVYDRRLLMDLSNNASQYLTTIGGHSSGLLDGFVQEDWASGVMDGLEFDKILRLQKDNVTLWVPRYKTGAFSIFQDNRRLYSDFSHMSTLSTDPRWELSYVELDHDCRLNSISVAVYKRQSNGLIFAERVFNYASVFTGDLVDGVRLSTELGLYNSDGDGFYSVTDENTETGFDVNSFSTRHNEHTIRGWNLYLNGAYEYLVGIGNSLEDIEATWESHSPVAGGHMFLKYLNVKNVSVMVNTSTGLVELPLLSSLDYIDDTTMGFSVDTDIGVIHVAGAGADSVSLSEAISSFVVSIPCDVDSSFLALPERGIVQIDNELIAYQSKGLRSLEDCVRGMQGTEADSHAVGSIVAFQTRGLFVTGEYWVKYVAVPRVDYEITNYDLRTANKTDWLNVHPFANMKSNKIIQIVSSTVNLSDIVLTTDEEVIGGTLYGPVFFGTDVGHLVATAYDASGSPVEDIELTLEKIYGPGTINSSGNSFISETNSSGEIYGYYNAPYEEAEVTLDVSDLQYDGSDTLVTVPRLPTGLSVSDVFIYQVLKHDPVLGTVGKKVKTVAGGSAVEPWGVGYLDCRCENTEDFNGGSLQISYSGVRYSFNIRKSLVVSAPGTESTLRFYLESFASFLVDAVFIESTVWLYQADAEVWDQALKRGAQVILYEWSENYTHPKTNVPGAYGPVHPNEISGTTLRFKNRLLPMPEPTDDTSNLGGYVIVSSAEAQFVAYGRDPYSGSIITSNKLRFRVSLPNTLTGVDVSGALPVPYGFTFITDDFNIGAGLGGSNFLTVNPSASGINQFTLRGSI